MSKRAFRKFDRNPRDFYATPKSAVRPLLPFLDSIWTDTWCEPCAGDGALVNHISKHFNGWGPSKCLAFDILPQASGITQKDAFDLTVDDLGGCGMIATNPPWDRKILHPMIDHFFTLNVPFWLLFDADWMHTKQSSRYIKRCDFIVSVGRVSWMENGVSGFDNCAWYGFGVPGPSGSGTIFVGR